MVPDASKDRLSSGRALRNILSNYAGMVVTLVSGFFLTPFILHQIGATSYGLWILIGSVVGYSALLDLGIGAAIVKYVAEYRARGEIEQARSLVATALLMYTLLGTAVILLALAVAPFFPDLFAIPADTRQTAVWLVLLSGLGTGLSLPAAATTAVLRGLQRFDLANGIAILATLISALATVAILLAGGGLIGIVAANTFVTLAMQLPSIWLIKRAAPELRFGFQGARLSLMRVVLAYSSALFVIQLGGRLQTKTDEIVIAAVLPVAEVTPYSLARRLSEMPQLLANQGIKILLPLASQLHAENDWHTLRRLYLASTRLTLVIFLPLGGAIALLGRQILTLWVGSEFAEYANIVAILILASAIVTSQYPAGSFLQGIARHRYLAVTSFASGLANIVLSILLVKQLGLAGVALGTLIPTAIECLVFVLPYTLHVLGVDALQAGKQILLPAILPAIPAASVLLLLQQLIDSSSLFGLAVIAGSAWLVYLLTYFVFGAPPAERASVRIYIDRLRHTARSCLKTVSHT